MLLSIQARFIWLDEAAVAERLEGAAGKVVALAGGFENGLGLLPDLIARTI